MEEGIELGEILALAVREKIAKLKFVSEEDDKSLEVYIEIDEAFKELSNRQE